MKGEELFKGLMNNPASSNPYEIELDGKEERKGRTSDTRQTMGLDMEGNIDTNK